MAALPPHGIQVPTTPTGPSAPALPSNTVPPTTPAPGVPSIPSDEGSLPPHGIAVPTNPEGPTGPASPSNTLPPVVPKGTPPVLGVGQPGIPNIGPPAPPKQNGKGKSSCGADSTPLVHMAFVNAVRAECDLYAIDPLAVFANAINEGLGGGIGDGGEAYGPWQDHLTEFSDRPWYGCGTFTASVNQWAWSADGIAYSIRQMNSGGAHGKTGHPAVEAIVRGYERPRDIPGAIVTRNATYDDLKSRGAGVWAYLASLARGPSTLIVPPAVPTVTPVKETKASTSFHDCMAWLAGDVPERGLALKALRQTMPAAVASELWSPSP